METSSSKIPEVILSGNISTGVTEKSYESYSEEGDPNFTDLEEGELKDDTDSNSKKRPLNKSSPSAGLNSAAESKKPNVNSSKEDLYSDSQL